ncbi:single-stranded DNA-binding protein [Janibacter limosus]|uniref:Single-stranded DNA-binding protein n=1 Tax=Janibacter limosus TaxID=53458 RepID=A0A4P6MT25_9MICO|nr:single-stranded DNA-binding protein [Janibacter limosus]QBF46026.1 single-stranded DNA-binding protein [Janibacter limosus]
MADTTTDERVHETNQVEITGRVSGDPTVREMPSGDELVTLRVVVSRGEGQPVDTIDCACWSAGARRAALRLVDGTRVRVEGSLRRRFFRTPGGAASRYEVEVARLVRDRR